MNLVQDNPFKDFPGGERLRRLHTLEVKNKRVLVRCDFNVPIKDGVIKDDTRIRATLPTLQHLRAQGARIICASHLGRPDGAPDPAYSLEPVAERLGELLGCDVLFAHEVIGHGVLKQAQQLKEGGVLVLENVRFYEGETKNTPEFCHKLSELCEAYVNDAFGTCHRAHASTAGVAALVRDKAPGLLVEAEVAALSKLIYNPPRPLVAVLGGSKVSDKIKVIEALMVKSSKILIGGAMAYTFLRAKGIQTGDSRVESDKVALAEKLLARAKEARCDIVLPVDHVTGASFDNPGTPQVTEGFNILPGRMGLDIGPKTQALFKKELQAAAGIFWNGPMGVFEKKDFAAGSFAVAHAIAEASATLKICGGGDSVAAVNEAGVASGFTHVSTGGGASLEMVEGVKMPGLEALKG